MRSRAACPQAPERLLHLRDAGLDATRPHLGGEEERAGGHAQRSAARSPTTALGRRRTWGRVDDPAALATKAPSTLLSGAALGGPGAHIEGAPGAEPQREAASRRSRGWDAPEAVSAAVAGNGAAAATPAAVSRRSAARAKTRAAMLRSHGAGALPGGRDRRPARSAARPAEAPATSEAPVIPSPSARQSREGPATQCRHRPGSTRVSMRFLALYLSSRGTTVNSHLTGPVRRSRTAPRGAAPGIHDQDAGGSGQGERGESGQGQDGQRRQHRVSPKRVARAPVAKSWAPDGQRVRGEVDRGEGGRCGGPGR